MSSSSSWLKSHQCSYNGNMMHWSSSSSSSFTMTLLSFIFLSPCPQRILFSSVNLLFLLILFFPFLKNLFSRSNVANNSPPSSLHKPLIATEPTRTVKVTIWFHLSLAAAALLAVTYTVVSVLGLCSPGSGTEWGVIEALSRLLQAIAYIAVLFLLADEKKSTAVSHPTSLRLYWAVNFALVALFSASGIARFLEDGGGDDYDTRTDDVASLVSLPVSAFLFGVAVHGSSGISIVTHVVSRGSSSSSGMAAVSEYAKASLLSKGMWLWINPVLTKGYKSVIKMDDVPLLPPDLTAERMTELFENKWPKEDGNRPRKNPVLMTLIRCFWREILFTGFLAIVRLVVVYVGPLLIQSFIDYSSGDRGSVYEGCYLILVLLMAKTVEVFSSHHLNFESRKLGMLMRSALISSIYKKGLRLSCSSRQAHGIGRIVNYMAMDCQQVADMMLQVHPIWLMPLQVGVALALLYGHLGVATMAALVALVAVLFFTLWITKKNNSFMYKVMMNRDSRMKATNELLSNMRVIKFQAWEDYFHERILDARRMEYGWLSKFMYSVSTNLIILGSVPILITALTFGVAIAFGVSLDAGTVFTATTIFKILQEPVRAFPQALTTMSQAMVSLGRLDRYLTSRESDDHTIERRESHDGTIAVEITGGTFSYDDDGGEEVLKDVILSVKKGELAAVVGTVGSGKSSLLASILGELHKVSGKVRVCGTTAYVAQTSWIQNATIEKNILFGSPMERERYEEVIRICCLEKDLEAMDHGDQTEIGERGINLSGGQKQRIQLARAVYQDCDIYLLDDVFSAVDAQTGSEIFKRCVRGALKDKTVILVTHQVDFLHNADLILVMRDRKIVQSGRYEELLESGLDFGALVAAHETSMELVEMKNSVSSNDVSLTEKPARASSIDGATNGEAKSLDGPKSKKSNAKLIEEEERETGQVSLKVYKHYSTETYGWFGVAAVILTSVLWQASQMASDFWLAFETSANHVFTPNLFITIYSIIAVITSVLMLIRTYFITFLGLKTGQSFFHQIVLSILHAPMSFFDTTPSGRILSRASTDQSNIDITIPMFFGMTILMYFMILGIVVMMCFNAWPTTFFIIPLAWLNWWYQRYYLASSRDLTRLDSISKAPVIHHFSETVSGVMTICCFRKQDSFIQENIDRVNANSRMVFYNDGANEWLGFRLELIGSFFLCISTIFMVFLPSTVIQPENVGLALSYGLPFNILLFSTVFLGCTVENKMVSVERIKQFISIPSEAAWRIRETLPSPNWPNHGNVIVNDLQVRYRPNTPLVLKGITFSIRGGEKIGVVGRTGSGKSTLIQVFFRLVEPSGGKIIIDGLDISKLGLHDLRSRFAIIPQDPVLFQGTVRSNMDPIGLYSDEEIWKSLERCQMKDVVAAKPEKLYAAVSDGGDNWSVGQRQLLCLGRVMLKNSRILFMDEATASVDSQTDALIQNIIREDFSSCTIITIAHRIPTVIDCDRVLVIDSGYAKEYDTPSKLLESASLFGALVQEYANRSAS